MANVPFKVARDGASGGALGDASLGDLEQGFTRLHGADAPDPFALTADGEAQSPRGQMQEGPLNQSWPEHDAGGFLHRPHGTER
jgi:hypothetical protein